MTSKQNLSLHIDGVNACEEKEYEHALGLFDRITEPSAQIFFNMGNCYLKLGYPREALQMFEQCVGKDKYLAVGFFQLAIAQTLCDDYTSGITNFQAAFKALRGNPYIDYKQLNMSKKLYACEINFNLGLLYLFSGDADGARSYFEAASASPSDSTRHGCISEAMNYVQRGDWSYFGQSPNHRLIHLPEQSFFRVSKAKMEGLQTSTNFMDSAKVVSASKEEYSFVGFVGAKKNSPAPNTTAVSKIPSPPSGPPPPMPTIPPPRLPPSVSPPTGRSPSPTPRSANKSPVRMPPSRPPPPNVTAPRPNSPARNRVNVDPEKSQAFATAPYSGVSKPVECELEFSLNLKNDSDYAEMLKALSKKLAGMASDLENSLQRKTMVLTVQDSAKKSTIAVTKSSDWQSTWSSVTKNRFSKPKLQLKELSGEGQGQFPHSPSHTPRSVSPALKPSRPAPISPLSANNEPYRNLQQDENIYHSVS